MNKFWLIWLFILSFWQLQAQNKLVKDSIYTIADQMPQPKGGYKSFYKYLQDNLYYTQEAVEKKIQGYVFVQFVVNTDGILDNIKVIRGLGFGLDEEAVRAFSESPPWQPAWHQGKKVKVRMTFNVIFRLAP